MPAVRRAPRRLGLLFPRRGRAAGGPRRARRRPGVTGPGTARPGRRLRRSAAPPGREEGRTEGTGGGRDPARPARRPQHRGRPRRTPSLALRSAPPAARRRPRRLSEPLPPAHRFGAGRAEGRRHDEPRVARAIRRRALGPHGRRRGAVGADLDGRGDGGRPATARAARLDLRGTGPRGDPAAWSTRGGAPQPGPPHPGATAASSGRRHQRRPLHDSRRQAAPRRPDRAAPPHHARRSRASPRGAPGAPPQGRNRDDPPLRRPSGGGSGERRARWPARLHARRPRLPLSGLPAARRRDARLLPATGDLERRARPFPPALGACPDPDRQGAGADREARPRRLLPDRLGPRPLLPARGDSRPGSRVGGQQRGLLRARHHGGRSGEDGPALRALPLGRAGRVAGHRPRPALGREARAGDPVRLPPVRRRRARR